MESDYEEWDLIYRTYPLEELPWELGRPRRVLVELVEKGLVKKGKALDICCGVGTNTVYLAQNGFEVTGIDISSKALEYAKEKAEQAKVNIRFMVRNFLELPFEDEEFDFAFDMGCFHHVKPDDRSTFIKGVNRVLKRDGSYLMVCFSDRKGPGWNHFTTEEITQLFSDLFRIKRIEHVSSPEGDNRVRYFYQVLMQKK